MDHKTIELDQGWDCIQKGITKLKKILEEQPEQPFSVEEKMNLYTTIYNMCTQKPPHDYSQQLYDKYREAFEEYITSTKVQHELLVVFADPLLGKEYSGCRALLRDDKVDDLSRMYRLYHKIPKGLEPIANTFKQHVTNEGTVLVQQAEDAASNQATTSSGAPEQVLIRKIIELHDKYMAYVTDF
ncbi:hypothetical protein SLEP1_g1248 [Rubroshorea leprosula]|uniref:Cullin N-terminal domain-containing protein n=1 Tax=Rubroshorea leprosula TaxID=152421 RepID=A0AAV5HD85_9ROSI|nr:hypothetical protein SLEP1_g1248 [Rubroshorea leprosula]